MEILSGVAHAFPGAGASLSGNFGPWNSDRTEPGRLAVA